jgi:peptidoglycan/xylan/chitin deacetylase (PgdA/CDA1 family)
VGATHGVRMDLAEPVEDIEPGAGVERLLCSAELDGELLGHVELPVCDGFVPAQVVVDALAGELFWPLICRHVGLGGEAAWERFLEELWGANAGATVEAAAGWHTLDVTEPLPDVRVRGRALNVEVTVGGTTVDALQVPARRGIVSADSLRETITNECGVELARAAVRDGVIGPLPRTSWPLIDEDTLVLPRWNRSCSARAALPVEAVAEFAASSTLAVTEEPTRARYEPSLLPRHAAPWPSEPAPAPGGETAELRILAYHRIADSGPASLRKFRLSPSEFDEQLHGLREQGYRSVTLDEWRVASRTRRPLPGKALMITFDDGYRDFAENAWPLLERHGFTATVFVVTGAVGSTSAWDSDYGDPAELMGWDEIRELSRRGVQFGSHTHSHPALCGLSNDDVVRELLASRTALEEQLGTPPSAIAYPYGDHDDVIAHLAGACGYSLGLTCVERHAQLTDHPLKVPRFEVRG